MKSRFLIGLGAFLCVQAASAQSISTVEDYDNQLPYWGTSWKTGDNAVGSYYPSFYTGFVMRQENPERIHVRNSRGNQARVTVILDQNTIKDYLFDLKKRYDFYQTMASKGVINVKPGRAKVYPHLSSFTQIIESSTYDILPFVQQAEAGQQSDEAIYAQSLSVLKALNPGRVFAIKLDLKAEFMKWKAQFSAPVASDKEALLAINSLVLGRVNATEIPSGELKQKLNTAITLGAQGQDEAFVQAAVELFKAATGSKYQIKVLNASGQFEDAIQCSGATCVLSYPEFTTIYPMGSAKASTSDKFGNKINLFATPGLWRFAPQSHQLDYIRKEPYYGFIPKMDYQNGENGFHNPAVRFSGGDLTSKIKQSLSVPQEHENLWAVKRGPVSHGCSRLPAGAVWEMRQIFPVENTKMNQVSYFGNNSQDFDVFDIDGDGQMEVMGVEYLISYTTKSDTGLSSREGSGLEVNRDSKLAFYTKLYGSRNVFTTNSSGQLIFQDPGISIQTQLDWRKFSVAIRVTLPGQYPLYEQPYEKDKIQFYSLRSMDKSLIRLMGRVKGCAPSSDKNECGEAAFDQEFRQLVR